jgi:hypothetical protein
MFSKFFLQLVAKRPLSPHVFEIDSKQFHYKMPLGAVSSVTNRVTGVMLSIGAHPHSHCTLLCTSHMDMYKHA